MSWRSVSIVLAIACMYLGWRDCNRSGGAADPATAAHCPESRAEHAHAFDSTEREPAPDQEPPPATASATPGFSINGFKLPAWAMWLAPHPGEDLRSYRDRMVPIAQAALAPHRARVTRSRDEFAALAGLDKGQRAMLDGAAQEAATAIQDKLLGAYLSGDFAPSSFKPMTGVAAARDVLDLIDRSNQKFLATLTEDQKARLAQHPFDFADYLLFSTRWEDALGVAN